MEKQISSFFSPPEVCYEWKELEPLDTNSVLYEFQHEYDSSKVNSVFKPNEKIYYSGNLLFSQILNILYLFIFTLLLIGFISAISVGISFYFVREREFYFAFIISGMELIAIIIFASMFAFIRYKKSKFSKFIVTQERVIILDKYYKTPIHISYFTLKRLRKVIFHFPIRGTFEESLEYLRNNPNERAEIEWTVPYEDSFLSAFDDKHTLFTTYSSTAEDDMRRIYSLLKSYQVNSTPKIQAMKLWKTSILFIILFIVGFMIIFGIYLAIIEFIRVGDYIVFCFIPMGIFALIFYSISLIYYYLYTKRKSFHVEFDFCFESIPVSYQTFTNTTTFIF